MVLVIYTQPRNEGEHERHDELEWKNELWSEGVEASHVAKCVMACEMRVTPPGMFDAKDQ